MTVLTGDWQILTSVEGGEILARIYGDRIRVSFPDTIEDIFAVLEDKEIPCEGPVVFEAGGSEGETVALFS